MTPQGEAKEEVDKLVAMAHANRGSAYLKSGQKREATAAFAAALSVDPGCKAAQEGKASLEQRRGSFSGGGAAARHASVSEARSEE